VTFGHRFLLAIIPLFVSIDPIGVLPFYISITASLDAARRKTVLFQALATAAAVGAGFVFLGQAMFAYLDITTSDFKVAGGLLLLVLAIYDLLFASESRKVEGKNVGVVPLGIPLIVGPAVLTTLVLQADSNGPAIAISAFVANLVLTLAAFLMARRIQRVVGDGGTAAFSKIASLLLAAIAVMMIRRGIFEIVGSYAHPGA